MQVKNFLKNIKNFLRNQNLDLSLTGFYMNLFEKKMILIDLELKILIILGSSYKFQKKKILSFDTK